MFNPSSVAPTSSHLIATDTDGASNWRLDIKHAIKDLTRLAHYLELDPDLLSQGKGAQQDFALMVPLPYLSRIEKGNLKDPLLRQILPIQEEREQIAGFVQDPLAEKEHNPLKALVHKYESRVLVIGSGSCAINCRYCFRRHFPYADNHISRDQWFDILEYIKAHPEVNEVILSGGDPLMMKDAQLEERIQQVAALPQIKRLRIHTRLPIVIPSRITQDLLASFANSRLKIIMVFHINHANEIDDSVRQACQTLVEKGVTLFNQGVILKGVNDDVRSQVELSETLFEANILPYYMFTLDPVEGAAHFDIPLTDAQALMGQVAAHLPGYLVPKLAKEIPGKTAKTLFAPSL